MKYDLDRFKRAQDQEYDTALAEIRSGHKYSHWIWYIFPQLRGLGYSSMSDYYGISGIDEARIYMEDEVLRDRMIAICQALLDLPSCDAEDVMGWPDDMKLRSSMTLFMEAAPEEAIFRKVLDKFFGGEADEVTLRMLR